MKVAISRHERLDAPGYVVHLVVGEGPDERTARFPVPDHMEAEELTRSIHRLVESQGSQMAIEALLSFDAGPTTP